MSGSTDNRKLLEQLQKLSFQHELEQASMAGSAASQMAEPVYGLQNLSVSASKSPDFSSASSEDRDPERGGGKLPSVFFPLSVLIASMMRSSILRDFASFAMENTDMSITGVRLDVSSLRGSPNSLARRSEAVGKALRPTMSATATLSV